LLYLASLITFLKLTWLIRYLVVVGIWLINWRFRYCCLIEVSIFINGGLIIIGVIVISD